MYWFHGWRNGTLRYPIDFKDRPPELTSLPLILPVLDFKLSGTYLFPETDLIVEHPRTLPGLGRRGTEGDARDARGIVSDGGAEQCSRRIDSVTPRQVQPSHQPTSRLSS